MNYLKLADDCVFWIKNWFAENAPGCKAVLGISGGKDSTVAAALCAKALGPQNVIGVALPSGNQSINDADLICKYLGITYICINIGDIERSFLLQSHSIEGGFTSQSVLNIPPRIRMTVLYAVAQTKGGLVANTCNLSEDYIGYATIFGDAAGAFSPLGKLCVREVLGVGRALRLPSVWVNKVPDDGLPGSLPDEVKLGFTYETLDHYIREGVCADKELKERIDRLHNKNLFKTETVRIPAFVPDLNNYRDSTTI